VTEIEESAPEKKRSAARTKTTISRIPGVTAGDGDSGALRHKFSSYNLRIPSASMEGTLPDRRPLAVNKFIFGGTGAGYEKWLPLPQLERGESIGF